MTEAQTGQRPEQDYLAGLAKDVQSDHAIHDLLRSAFQGNQRVSYTGLRTPYAIKPDRVIQKHEEDLVAGAKSVCVIENICPEWIGALGVAWNIPPDFFLEHVARPEGVSVWESVTGNSAFTRAAIELRGYVAATTQGHDGPFIRWSCIEGVLPYLQGAKAQRNANRASRRYEYDPYYGWQSHMRISYYRVSAALYLFLVDVPLAMDATADRLLPARLSLWVPYARNRGGLAIPQLYEQSEFSAFDMLQSVLAHGWQVVIFFRAPPDTVIDRVLLAYMMAASLWQSNMRFLDRDIKRLAFRDIRRPTKSINDHLHDRRHDLDTLRSEVRMGKLWILPAVEEYCINCDAYGMPHPRQYMEEVESDSADLEKFLMDTFQLLMSSISVLDSQTSLDQARRGSHLTVLATIYVPLSFVTGIYGMNVKEVNGSPLSTWVVVVTLVVIGGLTLLAMLLVKMFRGDLRSTASSGKQHRSWWSREKSVKDRDVQLVDSEHFSMRSGA